MTVSRVLNHEKSVRPSTREAVNAAIESLNYQPNPAARRLAGAQTLRFGLLYSNPSEAYLSAFLLGTLSQARRADVQLVAQKCEPGEEELKEIEAMINSGVDGVILPPPLCDSQEARRLIAKSRIPAVLVATAAPADGMSSVAIDDRSAARSMTNHLIDLGHRRIGFITGNANLEASAERLKGFREGLDARNIPFDPEMVVEGLFSYRSGLEAAEKLLYGQSFPSAIFASNDDMAAACVAVAHRKGMDVPGDLTVVGFDDSNLATTIWPELTTIRQPIADMSSTAIEILASQIRDRRNGKKGEPEHRLLDYTLIRRYSDAPPRRHAASIPAESR